MRTGLRVAARSRFGEAHRDVHVGQEIVIAPAAE